MTFNNFELSRTSAGLCTNLSVLWPLPVRVGQVSPGSHRTQSQTIPDHSPEHTALNCPNQPMAVIQEVEAASHPMTLYGSVPGSGRSGIDVEHSYKVCKSYLHWSGLRDWLYLCVANGISHAFLIHSIAQLQQAHKESSLFSPLLHAVEVGSSFHIREALVQPHRKCSRLLQGSTSLI